MKAVLCWFGSTVAAVCTAVAIVFCAPVQPKPTPRPLPFVMSALGSPANTDALVSANTFVVMSDQTRDLPLVVNAPTINGSINLSVTCCTDPTTGQPISATVANPTVSVSPAQLAFSGAHDAPATLTVKALHMPTIAFLVTIHGDNASRNYHATGSILVNVVKVPPDNGSLCNGAMTPGSGTSAEILPFNTAIKSTFMSKEATPAQTTWQIGASTKDNLHGWRLTIDNGGTLPPTTSTVVFTNNTTSLDKRIVPFNTSSCAASLPTTNFIASPGKSVTIPISSPSTTTLVLQEKVCRVWIFGCWSYGFDDLAVFDAPPFWTLFGGRRVAINWISGGADQ